MMENDDFLTKLLSNITCSIKICGPYNAAGICSTIACTISGYLVELRGSAIIKSCFTGATNVISILPYFSFIDNFTVYYILKDLSETVIIVQQVNNRFEVIETLHNIRKVEIDDFEETGEAQVAVWHIKSNEREIILPKLTSEDNIEEGDNQTTSALFQLLQKIQLRLSQLNEELHVKRAFVRKYLEFSWEVCKIESKAVIGREIKSTLVQKPCLINISDYWQRIVDKFWILGMKINNSSSRLVSELTVSPKSKCIKDYSYRFVNVDDIWNTETCNSLILSPGTCTYLIIWVNISEGNLLENVKFSLKYSRGMECETVSFSLASEDIFNGQLDIFRNDSPNTTRHDFLAILCLSKHISINITTPLWTGVTLEDVLKNKLKMEEFTVLGPGFYVRNKGNYNGILLHTHTHSKQPYSVALRILARDDVHICLLIDALYNLLPYRTTINFQTLGRLHVFVRSTQFIPQKLYLKQRSEVNDDNQGIGNINEIKAVLNLDACSYSPSKPLQSINLHRK